MTPPATERLTVRLTQHRRHALTSTTIPDTDAVWQGPDRDAGGDCGKCARRSSSAGQGKPVHCTHALLTLWHLVTQRHCPQRGFSAFDCIYVSVHSYFIRTLVPKNAATLPPSAAAHRTVYTCIYIYMYVYICICMFITVAIAARRRGMLMAPGKGDAG